MFDAKSLLEQLAAGARPAAAPGAVGSGGGLGALLEQLTSAAQGGRVADGTGGTGIPALDSLLGNLNKETSAGPGAQGGGLDGLLAQIKEQAGKLGGDPATGGNDLLATLGNVFGQATSGAREGAQRIGNATGAGDVLGQLAGGRSPEELMAMLKDLVSKNQLGAGAVLGGLGAVLLGTRTGRSVTSGAVKLSALALIGGLAYKAYQNYEAGRPLITGADGATAAAAPLGSGFEPEAVSNETAQLIIRAMIAAASADGRIDDMERQQIISALGSGPIDPEARSFVEAELRSPASPAQLAAAVRTPEQRLQIYTAARVAIDADSSEETAFLGTLASALGIDRTLAAHIDATARSPA